MIKSGLAFVASNLTVHGDVPVEVLPGQLLRRARPNEIEIYRELLAKVGASDWVPWARFENDTECTPQGGGFNHRLLPLPPEKWRYWVLAFEAQSTDTYEAHFMGALLDAEFSLSFTVYFDEPEQQGQRNGWQYNPWETFAWSNNYSLVLPAAREISTQELQSIAHLRSKVEAVRERHAFIPHALTTLHALRSIPGHSDLLTVGYFAIIESLVTHKPRLTETLDSINHQVSNKMILVRKRFARPIAVGDYFDALPEDKVWKKLYAYRSMVAHGDPVDWNKGDLVVLKSQANVHKFLLAMAKQLIMLAIDEPEFISDLRQC